MDDNDITAIVGWPTEPQMVKFRRVAAAAAAAERERCARACEQEAETWEQVAPWHTREARLCAARIRALD